MGRKGAVGNPSGYLSEGAKTYIGEILKRWLSWTRVPRNLPISYSSLSTKIFLGCVLFDEALAGNPQKSQRSLWAVMGGTHLMRKLTNEAVCE
jgi:hypothetical protein